MMTKFSNPHEQASKIICEAQSWIGTPYVHQASCKKAGADCLGLVRGVWRSLFGSEPIAVPYYKIDADEWRGQDLLSQALDRHFVRLAQPRPGCVLLFKFRASLPAKHLGIMLSPAKDGTPQFVHSQSVSGVCKMRLDKIWQQRLVASFAFPNIFN